MAEITIRPLAATDREAWTPLWHGYLTFYKATLPPEIDALTFGRLTGGEEPMGGFLAFQGDKPLGMVNWVLHRTTWSEKPICYLQDLFTVPESRGTGVGEAKTAASTRPIHSRQRNSGGRSASSVSSPSVDCGRRPIGYNP